MWLPGRIAAQIGAKHSGRVLISQGHLFSEVLSECARAIEIMSAKRTLRFEPGCQIPALNVSRFCESAKGEHLASALWTLNPAIAAEQTDG